MKLPKGMLAAAALMLLGCDSLTTQQRARQSDARPAARADHFERKRACLELGEKAYERDVRDAPASKTHLLIPTFCYNESLNTCLYSCGTVGADRYAGEWVRDCLTNETLAEYISIDGRVVSVMSRPDFEWQKAILMAGCAK